MQPQTAVVAGRECLVLVQAVGDHQGALGLFDGGAGADGVVHGLPGGRAQVAAQGIGDVDEVAVDLTDPAVPVLLSLAEGDDGADPSAGIDDAVSGTERLAGADGGGQEPGGAGPVVGVLVGGHQRGAGDDLPGLEPVDRVHAR